VLSLLKRYRDLIVVGFLLLYPFAAFLSRGGKGRDPHFLDRAVLGSTAPLQSALGWLIDSVANGWNGYVALRGVREQNTALQEQNAALQAQLHVLTETKFENERLKKMLAYSEVTPGEEILARVIGVNPVSTLLSVRINRGEDSGVRKGMPVVTQDGVVGHVERATGGYADVVLLTDRNTSVGIRDQRSRGRANAVGAGKDLALRLTNALRTEDFKDDDVVVTSGTDGIYPPGLMVGRLANVRRSSYGMFQSGEIHPAVDTTHLEEVLVLPAPFLLQEHLSPYTGRAGGAQ
jgi:rod shape-determining protein MreC